MNNRGVCPALTVLLAVLTIAITPPATGDPTAPEKDEPRLRLGLPIADVLFGANERDEWIREIRGLQLWIIAHDVESFEAQWPRIREQSPDFAGAGCELRFVFPELYALEEGGLPYFRVHVDPEQRFAQAMAHRGFRDGVTTMLTEDGVLRYMASVTDLDRAMPALAVRQWFTGQAIYNALCTRCHGADGNDTGYPFITPLNGIGERMDYATILHETEATGVVDLGQLDDDERIALALYVAGL